MKIFTNYTSKEIKPTGWLLDQLKIQANGLSGHLDKMWSDVKDSKWVGGDKEGWERVPYWLDGFIPLAYLLQDEDMIARAKKYVDAIIAGQRADGWICPCEDNERGGYDMWALFLLLKVLIVYHDCSGDERIVDVVYRALRQYYHFNRGNTVFDWAAARWYEGVISIAWMYDKKPERWLLDLAMCLEVQGIDYYNLNKFIRKPAMEWSYYNHVVNLAMAIKADAVMSCFDKRNPEKRAEKYLANLTKYHGNVNGYFNGDECLAGTSPSRGTELCGVAEAMYSHEVVAQTTLSTVWMDRCERLAFNAFPATVSQDMWTHQYDQLSNQPYCVEPKRTPFTTNTAESHLFGLEPHFGCCTANHNQAFPKFALSCYMKARDGIAVTSLAPCSLETEVNGSKVTVLTDTLYPFRDTVKIKVSCSKPTAFKLYIRIPGFYDSAKVNGADVATGKYYEIEKQWDSDEINIQLFAAPKFIKRGTLNAVVRGALTYSVPVKERWEMKEYIRDGVERKFPYCDYQIYAESEWQYGWASEELEYTEKSEYECAFSTAKPLCAIKAKVQKIDWGFREGIEYIVADKPKSRKAEGAVEEIELIPYACAKLRMTELPFVE